MNTMDDYIPSDAEVVEGASQKRPAAILVAHLISMVLWVAFAMYDIHKHAAGNRAVSPARVGAANGKLGVTRYAIPRPRSAMTRARASLAPSKLSARVMPRPPRPSRIARRPSGCYRVARRLSTPLLTRGTKKRSPFLFLTTFFFRSVLRRRFALGLGRLAVFAFAVFFVLYHLCYENIKHHTDGMEYLSDWTFVLLGAVFGMFSAFSLAPETFASENVADLAVVAHSVVWPTNILSTIGAWYSFVFFPQCVALEGVDNYPWCYLEWYRLSEHGLNMIMLALDGYFGNVPIRRGDLGHTLVFMAVYTVWTWYLQVTTGKCPYVMFDFNAGWESVAWFNAAMAGVVVAFFLVKKAYDARDAKNAKP